MPEFDADRAFPSSREPRPNWSVAITDYELRHVASLLPEGKSLPVAMHGDVLVLVPTGSDMAALVALARLRPAVDALPEPETDVTRYPQNSLAAAIAQSGDLRGIILRALAKVELTPEQRRHVTSAVSAELMSVTAMVGVR
jgi:hypothetical protein